MHSICSLLERAVVDLLFVIIELFSLSLMVDTLQAEICRSRHFSKRVGHFVTKL